ncbi:hypothetical protein J4453_01030 [Candidatus Woesearchaeota archaeon]|nr:hypothetical protein [Candidatus Woesearchaeota archaeon]
MATTIQISGQLHQELAKRKLFDRESYEEVIWDILEDTQELSEQTKKEIAEARKEVKEGRVKPLEQIKKELGL